MTYIQYVIILFAEIVVLSGFVYIIFSKAKGESSRRWKASVVVAVLFGVLIHICFIMALIMVWIDWANFETLFIDFFNKYKEGLLLIISADTLIILPMIIIGIFVAYIMFWQSGDRYVEKFWRNPKISYREHPKPPFLKF